MFRTLIRRIPPHALTAVALAAALASCISTAIAGPFVWVGSWGTHGSGPGQLCNPAGVAAVGSQFIYVADQCNSRIQKFTTAGDYVTHWATASIAIDVAIGPGGTVVFPDVNHHKIQRYDANGAFLGEWGVQGSGDDQLQFPGRVGVASNGDVYVTESFSPRVRKFSSDGTFLLAWGEPGSGPGQSDQPGAIVVDHHDNVWVSDSGNGRVQKFTPEGTFLLSAGSVGSGDGQFALYSISELAVDLADNLYVAEAAFVDRIQQFDSQGAFLTNFGNEPGPNALSIPSGIAVDDDGFVYVSDMNERISKFSDHASPVTPMTWGRLKTLYR